MRMKKSTLPKKSPRLTGTIGVRALFLAGICVMGAAIVIAARKPSNPGEMAAADVHLEKAGAVDAYARKAAASKAVAATTSAADANGGKASAKAAPVTITGCLEKSDQTFRLKDTSGTDVPKARSWKSGFLKKGSASIDVVDAANKVKLPSHVGQRVSVTGTLVDREMQVRSLQRVSASCSKNAGV
jgi:hypothetical protein